MKKLLFFILFSLIFSCNNDKQQDTDPKETTKPTSKGVNVSVSTLKPQIFNKQIISNGTVASVQKVEMRFKTAERIANILVKNGQNVSKGQTLASLDNQILSNQLNKAKINLNKAKNKLDEEKINYGITTNTLIDPIILQNLQIKSGFLEAQNSLENAQLLYAQSVLKSPFSGVVANLETKVGNFTTASEVFCTIINQNKLEVVFSILESELALIKKGQEVSIQHFSNEEQKFKGIITEINPLIDVNGLIKIKAIIKKAKSNLFHGMHVKIKINKPLKDVIVIPKEALVMRANREVVFTVKKGLAKWNYVEIVAENSTSYAIKNSSQLTDTIIISGNLNLSHDALVNSNKK